MLVVRQSTANSSRTKSARSATRLQYVVVDGNATMLAGRFTADALWPLGESEQVSRRLRCECRRVCHAAIAWWQRTFVAPTFGASFIGQADITPRIGIAANLGFTQFTGFDRDKLRPSDPALADPVFLTPLVPPPAAEKSFGGIRAVFSVTYRLGVKKSTGGRK